MSELILPRGTRGSGLSATETKLTVSAIMCASYARMLWLGQKGAHVSLTSEEERDLKRLMGWYNNLGTDMKDKMEDWIYQFSRDTHDVSERSGRKVGEANQKALKRVTKWNTAQ